MNHARSISFTVVFAILLFAGMAPKAHSQEPATIGFEGWGIRAGASSDPDQLYGGIHINLGRFTKDVRFRPTMEVGLGDDQTLLQVLGEVHYVFSHFQTLTPYLGGGLGLTYVNYDTDHRRDGSDTEGSLCAIAGIETELNLGTKLFFEFKVGIASDDPDVKFGIGITW